MKSKESAAAGHLFAVVSVIFWGTTFISTKILLNGFTPIEILFFRFLVAYVTLLLVYPRKLKTSGIKQELMLAGAGLSGVTLYFLLENIALTYSTASNVGIIVSAAPLFTGIFAHWFLDGEKLTRRFFIGFATAMAGILLISLNGSFMLKLNPIGDLLALMAAIVWGVYSILAKKISSYNYNTIAVTRRMFLYGILFVLPVLFVFDFKWGPERFLITINLFNILFLGLGASALCYVTWNYAIKLLGAVKSSVYIYVIPAVTVVTSVIVLKEKVTWPLACGTALTLIGLFLSDYEKIRHQR